MLWIAVLPAFAWLRNTMKIIRWSLCGINLLSVGTMYPIHEPDVQCIWKGKERKKSEFGNKVSIIRSMIRVILDVCSFRNEYDGYTIEQSFEQVCRPIETRIKKLAGYRVKNIGWMLDWTNVFNTCQFVNYSYSDISSYYSVYNLRPSEILLRVRFKIL